MNSPGKGFGRFPESASGNMEAGIAGKRWVRVKDSKRRVVVATL